MHPLRIEIEQLINEKKYANAEDKLDKLMSEFYGEQLWAKWAGAIQLKTKCLNAKGEIVEANQFAKKHIDIAQKKCPERQDVISYLNITLGDHSG